MNIESHAHQAIDHVLDLGFGGAFLHYYDHIRRPRPFALPIVLRC
jgi:hypothetical protein